LKEIKQKPY